MHQFRLNATALLAVASLTVSANAQAADYANDSVEAESSRSLRIGAAIGLRPTYEGSDEYEAIGFPIIAPKFNEGSSEGSKVSFRGIDDIRYRLIDWQGLEAGPLAGYDFGRDESDGDLLQGLGDIDGGVIVGGYVGYRVSRILFDAAYLQNVTSDADTGFELRFSAQTAVNVTDRTGLTLTAGTTYASDDFVETYFGVSAAQAAASTLPAFATDAGFKDVYLDAKVKTELTDKITLHAGARYQRLIGDAADSPIVASEDQFFGSLGLSYRFGFGHR